MQQAMGKGGVTLVTVIAVAMSAIAYSIGTTLPAAGLNGICLPSPDQWGLGATESWLINLALLLGCTATLYFLNKVYSVVPGSSTILPPIFLLMSASIPWVGGMLTSSLILAPVAIIALAILFSAFGSKNATQELFIVATFLSFGSMIQYAFVFMLVPVVLIAGLLKELRVKEILAMLLGIISPYWIVLGLGLISPEQLSIPSLTNLFAGGIPRETLFAGCLNLASTAVITLIMALYNGIKLYAGNTRRRLFNFAICIMGLFALCGMVVDFNNFTAYIVTFYMAAAFQYADLFALWNIRRAWVWSLILCSVYVAFFTVTII